MTRLVLFALLAIVAGAAAVLSFAALDELGRLCGFGPLAALLPLVLDAGAAAGTVAWLGRTGPPRQFGRVLALVLLGGSVAGNATAHGLAAYGLVAPWWAVVVVSALPPAVLGAVVHLATLTAQGDTGRPEQTEEAAAEGTHDLGTPVTGFFPAPGETPTDQGVAAGDPDRSDDDTDRAAALIAEGVGRRRLARELGISEHQAREMLGGSRNGHAAGVR
ncbi:DUF2637 domain-containing protein [Pseudonocardia sp.]|jgi:hypothetical protein|uniref:DUF2637 domain-containing protein n=1 Tax=Pseudonocardia sp. TaxID=60912 RepID=UPI0026257C1A|nr:DUF2637 domain-containing protein [Pseudonocardia sp.]MCW2722834.1 hypothetical protein [Pseudonocardia sp.]